MKVAIRVDASEQIGTGHVMRCLTLAEELRSKAAQVRFVCREHPGNLIQLVEHRGFQVHRLHQPGSPKPAKQDSPPHLPWLGTDQEPDAEQSINALADKAKQDWIVVDHYALGSAWETRARRISSKILAIDDLADRDHNCDLLLDQNYFQEPEKRYQGLLPKHCQQLLGPKYALLRQEVLQARRFCRLRGNGLARILVYFGGSDAGDLTGLALEALDCAELRHLPLEVVAGANNPHLESLQQKTQARPLSRLHVQPQGFVELMLRADLCIGAGGVTTWERLCLGLPSLVITVAKNQKECIWDLHQAGYLHWVGHKDEVGIQDLRQAILWQTSQPQGLKLAKHNPVDGLGAARVASILTCGTGPAAKKQ